MVYKCVYLYQYKTRFIKSNLKFCILSVNSICYDDYSATLNSLIVPVSEENTVPTLKSLRPSVS